MLRPDHWNLLRNRENERLAEKPELKKETDEVKWNKWNRCMEAISLLRGRLQATRPDVIVLGTHQRSGFERLRLGSVAETVTLQATQPVLMVPALPGGDPRTRGPESGS